MPTDYRMLQKKKGPDLLGSFNQGLKVAKNLSDLARMNKADRKAEEHANAMTKFKQKKFANTPEGQSAFIKEYKSLDPQGAKLYLQTTKLEQDARKAQRDQQEAKRTRDIDIVASTGEKFLSLPKDQQLDQWGQYGSYLESQGVDVSSWDATQPTEKAFQDIQGAIAQNQKGKKGATGKQFADTKLQKFVDDNGFMRTFNPSGGPSGFVKDKNGKKIKATETQRYLEGEKGFYRVPTKTKKAPELVPGITPANKVKRRLEIKRATLAIKKMDLDIKKAAKDASEGGQFKASQYVAAVYGVRMVQAAATIKSLKEGGFDRTRINFGIMNKLPNWFQDPELQRQVQSERNFINALLRRESGAAIAESEFENAQKQYFPKSGDDESVLEQKKRNREIAIAGMEAESGGAWSEVVDKLPFELNREKKKAVGKWKKVK